MIAPWQTLLICCFLWITFQVSGVHVGISGSLWHAPRKRLHIDRRLTGSGTPITHRPTSQTGSRLTVAAARVHRRDLLRAALGGAAGAVIGFKASPVRGQAKKFAG